MKYIDVELLEAELKRRIKERDNMMKLGTYVSTSYVYEDMLALIDSLQQEQPQVDLEREIIRYKVPFSDDKEYLNETTLDSIAHHFYNLGRNSRKEE